MAGIGIFNHADPGKPHIHALLVSRETPFNKPLLNASKWRYMKRAGGPGSSDGAIPDYTIHITSADDVASTTLAKYCIKEKNMALYRPDDWHLMTYRPRLLNKITMGM